MRKRMLKYFSRGSICLIAGLILVSTSSFARNIRRHKHAEPVQAMPELMTYQQLMMLSPAKRVAYIKDVRQVLVLLEKMEIKARSLGYSSVDNLESKENIAKIESLRSTLQAYLVLLPEAKAESDMQAKYWSNPKVWKPNTRITINADGTWSIEVPSNLRTYKIGPFKTHVPDTSNHGPDVVIRDYRSMLPAQGLTQTNEEWNGKPKTAPPVPVQGLTSTDQEWKGQPKTANVQSSSQQPPAIQDPSQSQGLSGGVNYVEPKTVKTDKITPDKESAQQNYEKLSQGQTLQPTSATKPDEKVAAKNTCKAVGAGDMDPIRKEWANKKSKTSCVNGGNFSDYTEVAQGKCSPVHKLENPPSNVEYMSPNGKKEAGGCSASEELCSPVVFCDSSAVTEQNPNGKVKAFCISLKGSGEEYQNKSYTLLCAKATAAKAGKSKCDPMGIKGATHEAWNSLAKAYKENVNTYCSGDSSQSKFNDFFCVECTAIKKQMAKWSSQTATASPAPASPNQFPGFNGYGLPTDQTGTIH